MRALLLSTSLCFCLASLAQAAPKTLKFDQGTATYTNRDAFASWEGNTSDIGGTLILDDQTGELVKGEIQIGLAAIDSGNGARDARMRGEFLQTEKYPKATFVVTKLEGFPSVAEWKKWGLKQTGKIHGDLTIKEVTRPVVFEAEAVYLGTELKVSGKGQTKMTDFGISPPSLLFVTVDDAIGLKFQAVARPVSTNAGL
ncbi:YceI family protein [Gloeobacter violaceus]|nr:YceI family protein [Gloeobacter violaceus]